VITSISLDHTKQLGETIPEIAREKAGIIKSGRPVVSSVLDPAAKEVIEERARDVDASLFQLGNQFHHVDRPLGLDGTEIELTTWRRKWPTLRVGPIGEHQAANAATALAVIDLLESSGTSFQKLPGKSLATIRLPGRVEIYHRDPFVLLDVAHNPASFEALTKSIRRLIPPGHRGKRVFVFGTSRDKDWQRMLRTIEGVFTHVILTQYHGNQRALPADEIQPYLNHTQADVLAISDPREAWQRAGSLVEQEHLEIDVPINNAGRGTIRVDENIICVAGSFYLFSELLSPSSLVPDADSI
jgi:dihydrofolate synthase/folylpolyglutamate synthase